MPTKTRSDLESAHSAGIDLESIDIVGGLQTQETVNRAALLNLPEQSDGDYGVPLGRTVREEVGRYFQIAKAHWAHFDGTGDSKASSSEVFVKSLLEECLGFTELQAVGPVKCDGRVFQIKLASHKGKVPVVVAATSSSDHSSKCNLDTPRNEFASGTRRRTATQLLQEYLNARDDALWGLALDGRSIRLMRTNRSLTRSAWLEFDLESILREGSVADFSILWLLLHASRFGGADAKPEDCPLERWRLRGLKQGTAIRENLRQGVEEALTTLGSGFLSHQGSHELRSRVRRGDLTKGEYFEELLRLVYRLILVFVAEDRDLLHAPNASVNKREAYRKGYAASRLRERCRRNSALDTNQDSWHGLRALFRCLRRGAPELGLAPLGGLFEDAEQSVLDEARISNRDLLTGIWNLSWFRPDGQRLERINWHDMETEELGSVYESLLELIPVVDLQQGKFGFVAAKGSTRKTTGSYYTPESIVSLVLETTLDPLLDAAEARGGDEAESEILKLRIVDPACGSGHFLLEAARRLAQRLARHRSADAPSQEVYQHATRDVITNCIFGVDINPLAVDLCKVALWIEALEPGMPLSFLDAHIRCGDSLVGVFDYRMVERGLPDAAFQRRTGDDKDILKDLRSLNKVERMQPRLFRKLRAPKSVLRQAERVLAMREDTLGQSQRKAEAWQRLRNNRHQVALQNACDLYVAAFLLSKSKGAVGALPGHDGATRRFPTTGVVWRAARGDGSLPAGLTDCIAAMKAAKVLHWPVEFPAIVQSGGFDAVIGNPPWERIKLQEKEFFAARDPYVAEAPNKAARARRIKRLKLPGGNPKLVEEFETAKGEAEAKSAFLRKSGRYPLTGTGDINTYAVFSELFVNLTKQRRVEEDGRAATGQSGEAAKQPIEGRAGIVVPTGIATDSTTSPFFKSLVTGGRLAALYDFENRKGLFRAVHRSYRFSVLAISKAERTDYAAFLHDPSDLADRERRMELKPSDIAIVNPNTHTAPLFRARADRDLTLKLHRAAPPLIRERPGHPEGDDNPWGISFQTVYHMSNDSRWFRTAERLGRAGFERDGTDWRHRDGRRYVPLYEAKMVHHYDHRYASYAGLSSRPRDGSLPKTTPEQKADPNFEVEPWYWVPEDETKIRLARVPSRLKTYYRKGDEKGCLKVLAEWVVGTLGPDVLAASELPLATREAESLVRRVLGGGGSRAKRWA